MPAETLGFITAKGVTRSYMKVVVREGPGGSHSSAPTNGNREPDSSGNFTGAPEFSRTSVLGERRIPREAESSPQEGRVQSSEGLGVSGWEDICVEGSVPRSALPGLPCLLVRLHWSRSGRVMLLSQQQEMSSGPTGSSSGFFSLWPSLTSEAKLLQSGAPRPAPHPHPTPPQGRTLPSAGLHVGPTVHTQSSRARWQHRCRTVQAVEARKLLNTQRSWEVMAPTYTSVGWRPGL